MLMFLAFFRQCHHIPDLSSNENNTITTNNAMATQTIIIKTDCKGNKRYLTKSGQELIYFILSYLQCIQVLLSSVHLDIKWISVCFFFVFFFYVCVTVYARWMWTRACVLLCVTPHSSESYFYNCACLLWFLTPSLSLLFMVCCSAIQSYHYSLKY